MYKYQKGVIKGASKNIIFESTIANSDVIIIYQRII